MASIRKPRFTYEKLQVLPHTFGDEKMQIVTQHIGKGYANKMSKDILYIYFGESIESNQDWVIPSISKVIRDTDIGTYGSQKYTKFKTHIYKKENLKESYKKGKLPRFLLCTTTKQHFDAITDLMFMIEADKKPDKRYKRIMIYIENFHYVVDMKGQLDILSDMDNNRSVLIILGLTMLVNDCQKYGNFFDPRNSLSNFKYDNVDLSKFYPLADLDLAEIHIKSCCAHVESECEETCPVKYLEFNIRENRFLFFGPDRRIFAPSGHFIESHIQMKNMILRESDQAVVFIINSSKSTMHFLDRGNEQEHDIFHEYRSHDSFSEVLPLILEKYNLLERPYFITGHQSFLKPIKLCHEKLGPFTTVVLSPPKEARNYIKLDRDNDKIYLFATKASGPMLHWDKAFGLLGEFNVTIFLCPLKVYEVIKQYENGSLSAFVKCSGAG